MIAATTQKRQPLRAAFHLLGWSGFYSTLIFPLPMIISPAITS
jgi:hypothetical protein